MARPKRNPETAALVEQSAGARVRAARRAAGLTQVELAGRCGVHPNSISNVERGVMDLTADLALRIASACGVAPGSLLPGLPWGGGAVRPAACPHCGGPLP